MKELNIIIRSVLLHIGKSRAVAGSIAAGVAALFLIGGYYEYNFWGLKQALIRSRYAHLQIYQRGYLQTRDVSPFENCLEDSGEIVRLIQEAEHGAVCAPRSKAMAVANGEPVEVWGVVPETESRIFTFFTSRKGLGLSSEDGAVCQISPVLAERLGVRLGETVSVACVDSNGMMNACDLTVQSLIGSYAEDFDQIAAVVPESVFSDLFGTGQICEIAVLLENDRNLHERKAVLQKTLIDAGFDAEVTEWSDQATYFHQVVRYYEGFYRIVMAVVAVIVFFVTFTTMSLSLLERMKEFGVCLSLGTRKPAVVRRVLCETLVLGAAGCVIGSLIAFAVALAVNRTGGIMLPASPGMAAETPLRLKFSAQAAVLSLAAGFIVPPLALIFPAAAVFRRSIVELLRG